MESTLTRLVEWDRIPVGRGVFVPCQDKELAVFRLADPDRVFVIDNACPHSGGNLSGGQACGTTVSCPVHQWTFDLRSGLCVDSPKARVRVYRCEIRDGIVYADLGG